MSVNLGPDLAPFLDPDDPVVSVVLGALEQIYNRMASDFQAMQELAAVLPATGSDLDYLAALMRLPRMPQETDAALMTRMAAMALPRMTPDAFVYQLGIVNSYVAPEDAFVEPSGGVTVGWDPAWAFHYDREAVAPTYTRASVATGPDGAQESNNTPTWLLQTNTTYWAGVFQGTVQLLTGTDFATSTGGIPTGYTETLATGDTMTLGVVSGYPISGDTPVTWSRATAGASATTFTSPAATVSASTEYAFSVYINTTNLQGGSVELQVYDTATATTTTLAQQGTVNGYTRLYGHYTTGASASTLQLQISFPAVVYGSMVFGSPQIEQGASPTEYLRNSSTASTASRSASTLSFPSSTLPIWGQGTFALALQVTPATQGTGNAYLIASEYFALYWNGTAWVATVSNGTDTTTLQATGALSVGMHYFVFDFSDVLGRADLYIDGTLVDSVATGGTVYPPYGAGSTSLYVGSDTSGAHQINGYIGNLSVMNALMFSGTSLTSATNTNAVPLQWAASLRTPIYAQTMVQANFENRSLAASTGGTEFGVAYYLFVNTQGLTTPPGQNPFYLDVSGMDSGFALQPPSLGWPFLFGDETGNMNLADNIAAGVSPEPQEPGQLQ